MRRADTCTSPAVGRDAAREHLQQGGLAGAVGSLDEDVLPRGDVEPRHADAPVDDEIAHADGPGACCREVRSEPQRWARLAHLVAFEDLDALLGVTTSAARGLLHPGALERVDELVVVPRRAVVRDVACRRARSGTQVGKLGLLGGIRLLPASLGIVTKRQVCRVVAGESSPAFAVGPEVAGVEVDDRGADGVEEGAVVAGDEDGAGELVELGLEVVEGLVVEVVGGFVEDEALGASGEEGGEGEAAALASAELGDRAGAVDGVEAEAVGGDLGSAVGVPGVVEGRPGEEFVIGLCRNGIGEVVAE